MIPADRPTKRRLVGEVFRSSAPKYELMNDLMSLGLQRWWRRAAVAAISPSARFLLDIGGGKGDIAARFLAEDTPAREGKPARRAIVADPSKDMLVGWKGEKVSAYGEELPFRLDCFDAATMAFSLRNSADRSAVLAETFRVLAPYGQFICLELGQPKLFRAAHRLWLKRALPFMAGLVGSGPEAYQYLGDSILQFETPPRVCRMLERVGFVGIRLRRFHGGIACLYSGIKPG